MAICRKRENVIGANRQHFYQDVSVKYYHVKYTGCVTVWRFVMLHWLWYRMTHCQVKGTGRGTV
jgi:hypothetical protein